MNGWAWLVIVSGMLFRAIGIFRPLLGNFAVHQTAHAMMSRFFIENHYASILYPQVNVLSAGKPALHLLAYPISSLLASILFTCFGGSLDFWGRFQSVLFFGGASFYLYRLVRAMFDERVAFVSLVAFSLSPLTIIYGQSFQNEIGTVFFSLLFAFELMKFIQTKEFVHGVLSGLGLSGVLLMRPNGLYLLIPAYYLAVRMGENGSQRKTNFLKVSLVVLIGAVLPALWYFHIWNVTTTSSNIYNTVFAQLATRSTFLSPLVFSLEYYRGLFDNLAGVTFTPLGLTFFIIGFLLGLFHFRRSGFFIVWSLAFLGSSLLIPRKLVDHNFYLLHFLVPATPLIAEAWTTTLKNFQGVRSRRIFTAAFLLIAVFSSLRYAAHPAFKTPKSEQSIPYLADKLKALTTKGEARVLVQGSHALLYYADRYGIDFKIVRKDGPPEYYKFTGLEKMSPEQQETRQKAWGDSIEYLEYLRKYEHVTHFVVTDPEEFYRYENFLHYMLREYPVIYEEKGVGYIFSLNSKK